ncbi:MAG: aldo/keto reductase [bacterium]|nr:aldo/keto reductase [bacterium]
MKRREFIKTSALSGVGLAALGGMPDSALGADRIVKYNKLGNTGLEISDISFGAGKLPASSLVLRAAAAGINYFDTAPDYGRSEDHIGGAMARLNRAEIILASKYCDGRSYPNHLPVGTKKQKFIEAVDTSLQRCKTDYLDLVFVHAMGELSENFEEEKQRLFAEEMLSATESLKKAGKIKHLAVSSHGPDNMEALLLEAVNSGYYDVIMPAFNFMKFPKVPDLLKAAKKKGVGVVAMKTLAGAKALELDQGAQDFAHAAFKWVLKHQEVAGLVVTMKTVGNLYHYIKASGQSFTQADQRQLDRYASRWGSQYCRTGCNDCGPACAQGVQIAKSLRHLMYFQDYGEEKKAIQGYAEISPNGAACQSCENPSCEAACPHGLPVKTMMNQAHQDLSLA